MQNRVLGTLLGIAVFVYLLAFPRVLNLSDEALFLYGAKRVLHGQALYRDVFEFITPAGFYFFALVFAVAGTSLLAARIAMAAVIAASCVLLYALARKVAGTAEATLAALVFAVACYPVWNMASPHWLSTFLALATAAVVLRDNAIGSSGAAPAAAGALAGLAFCNQQQRGVFLGVWVTVSVAALAWNIGGVPRPRRGGRALAWTAAGWAAVALAILGYSVWRASVAELVYAIFTFVLLQYRRSFAGAVSWGGYSPLTGLGLVYTWPWLASALAAVLGVEAVALGWALRRRRGRSEVLRGCLLLLAVLMAGSVLYFPDYIHVAFVAPFLLVVAARLLHAVRSSRLVRHGRVLPFVSSAVVAAAFLAVLVKGWENLALARRASPERYPSAFGTLAGTEPFRQILEGVRDAMRAVPPDRRTFFSYPADASLYLTVPGENPTPYSLLLPGYNTPEQYRTALAALERAPAQYVVINSLWFVASNDPVVEFLEGRYTLQDRVGPWGFYSVYARIDGAERR